MRRITLALALILMLTSVMFVLGQNDPVPPLQITVDNETCRMALAENAAATPEFPRWRPPRLKRPPKRDADRLYPVLTLGDGCIA